VDRTADAGGLPCRAGRRLQQSHDLTRSCVAPCHRLLEHRLSFGRDLEATTRRGNQLDLRPRESL